MDARVQELAYPAESAALFERVMDLPWPAFLDSGHPHYPDARYDIITAAPTGSLVCHGPVTQIQRAGQPSRVSLDDPLTLARKEIQALELPLGPQPFSGGALGYLAYDLGRRFERLPELAAPGPELPDMALGLYEWALVVDHHARRCWLSGHWPDEVRERLAGAGPAPPRDLSVSSLIKPDLSAQRYGQAFARIQHYIREGDCYQVNLARRFSVQVRGHPWAVYRHLRRASPAPFGAYLQTPYGAVLSVSPERFLQVRGAQVRTSPIKGTRARSAQRDEDRRLARELLASPKDRAENVMIVDLLRNDLGKSCATGSVRVPELCELQSFSHVHHLVSTVTGELAPGRDALDLLRGCFPGGSISGAPKLRAMQIIEELEPQRRGVYCGAIGYMGADGAMDTSIAIRTLVQHDDTLYFWAGGGIVADSREDEELQEINHKARAMLTLLQRAQPAARNAHGTGAV